MFVRIGNMNEKKKVIKKNPHKRIIGGTTGGGGGIPEIFILSKSRLRIKIPTRCEMRYDGEFMDWNGIPPDILVSQCKKDIDNGIDKQWDYAITYLNKIVED